ncbi:MAG: hypothetical protein ABR600_04705 [Actinomycetota bacterium]
MRSLARALTFATIAMLVLTLGPSGARGSIGGVTLLAKGLGMQWTFNEPGSPVPADPTGEMEQAYSTADYASGPTAHGLSSFFWPGSAGANFGPALCPQVCPPYPVRAEAFSPSNPHKDDNNDYGPNASMHAAASETSAEAATVTQKADQAAAAFVTGDFSSSSKTEIKGDSAISEATAEATDLTIAGIIHIDSVISEAQAVTDGEKGTVSGETKVTGATVQEQGVTIDEMGVHVADQTVPILDPINSSQVQQALAQLGITMKVAAPVDNTKGATAERMLGGLVVTFDSGSLGAIVPQQVHDQLDRYVQFNQTVTMNFGGVSVSSKTAGGYTVSSPPPSPPAEPEGPGGGDNGGGGGSGSSGGGTNVFGDNGGGGGGGGTQPSGSGGDGTGGSVGTVPVALPIRIPPGKAIPAVLVVFGLLVAAGSSRILKVIADRAVAGTAGDRCPLEDR